MSNISSAHIGSSFKTSLESSARIIPTKQKIESTGAIYTRPEVVDFILDLSGYTIDKPLHEYQVLEPSFGSGSFLLPIVSRLITSWRAFGSHGSALHVLGDTIRAIEIDPYSFDNTYRNVVSTITQCGIDSTSAMGLADQWLKRSDFLLIELDGKFDYVLGNPPYVRQEEIPSHLLSEYRTRYVTMYDRADIYIPFIERSLSVLKKGGTLGFICADRWMKNKYGGPLRRIVAEGFNLKVYVDMVNTPAFESEVVAYPAITIIQRERAGPTRIAYRPTIERLNLEKLSKSLRAKKLPIHSMSVRELSGVTRNSEPWLLHSSDQVALLRSLEDRFPTLEETGCRIGIGVATGADKEFIGDFKSLDVEPDRKLPLVMTKDIASGTVKWLGKGVINPFSDSGQLVDLQLYPRLRKYLYERKEKITKRHCAIKQPANWYRTIDRITPSLSTIPKLLIPDIKGKAHVVYENDGLYPHHNLYFVTSMEWDLRALQAVLLSAISRLFISSYSTQMRGGFLRFQAQYLRRIRLPLWNTVSKQLRCDLANAASVGDITACNRAAFELFELSNEEQSILGGIE